MRTRFKHVTNPQHHDIESVDVFLEVEIPMHMWAAETIPPTHCDFVPKFRVSSPENTPKIKSYYFLANIDKYLTPEY